MYELILLAWIILMFGVYKKKWIFTFIAGWLMFVLGISIWNNPIENLSQIINYTLGLLHMVTGIYYFFTVGIELIYDNEEALDLAIKKLFLKLKIKNRNNRGWRKRK